MRAARAMVILAAALVPGGCGTSERDVVKAKVQQFVKSAGSKDFKTICDQVLAPSLLERLAAGGVPCEQAMQIALGSVHDPTLSVGQVTISGSKASAIALSTAQGQAASLDAIELVKTSSGWRISSLGASAGGRGKPAK
jgi:hypothetical protein